MSEAQKKRMENPEERKRFGESRKGKTPWIKGKQHSKEIRIKMSEAQKILWANPKHKKRMSEAHMGQISSRKGKKHTPEAIFKMKESHKGAIAWNKGKKTGLIPWNKGIPLSKEQKIKMSESLKGRLVWNKGIKFPIESERSEQQIKVAKSSREHILRLYESGAFPRQENTKPERQIKEELIKRGYKEGTDFIHQYRFMDKFMCDFCFPKQKIIIEVYGDYWHANPLRYSIPKNKLQKNAISQDKKKEAYILKVDNFTWNYLVLWEMDIEKNVSKCVDKIEEVLREKRQI